MRIIAVICLYSLLNCCQDVAIGGSLFLVKMMGAYTEPSSMPSGNQEPFSETFTLKSITLTSKDGTQIELYKEDAKLIQINERPQIIFEMDMPETYLKQSFSSFSVRFESAVTGISKYNSSGAIVLDNPVITFDQEFEVTKNKDVIFVIQVFWKNTVLRDEAAKVDYFTSPELSMSLSSN